MSTFRPTQQPFDWRTIAALNAVSALAQVGQFGVAYVVLPVWLAEQGLDATQLGLFASSLWLGQLPGLAVAPWLCQRLGARRVIILALLCTVIALVGIAFTAWPFWLVGGALAGFGLGLRWIGLEPWLYRIAPAEARGRLVGFHETLIALAPIVAPALASALGLHGMALFWVGCVFTLAALLPLALARKEPAHSAPVAHRGVHVDLALQLRERVFIFGVAIALVGGMMEAALSGLFALFAHGRGITGSQTTDLLALFGLGGLLLQYPVGWLADHRGVGVAALWCAVGTVLVCAALALPMGYMLMMFAVFLLGGLITAFLTLALIASTTTQSGTMASNVSLISMLYTLSAVAGPLIAGTVMKASGTDALMWSIAAAALVLAFVLAWLMRAKQSSLA